MDSAQYNTPKGRKSAKTEITITVGAEDGGIPFTSLNTVLSGMIGLLKSMASQVDSEAEIEWQIVRATMNSPMALTFAPLRQSNARLPRRVLREFVYGVQSMDRGSRSRFAFQGQDARTARTMVSVLNDRVNVLNFEVPGVGIARPTKTSLLDPSEFEAPRPRYEITTFQGRLENIATHADDFKFTIFDVVTSQAITCKFADRDLSKVGESLRKRVRVSGRVCFVKDVPTQIDVDEFSCLDENIVNFLELPGINITDGKDAADYVKAMRNGEI